MIGGMILWLVTGGPGGHHQPAAGGLTSRQDRDRRDLGSGLALGAAVLCAIVRPRREPIPRSGLLWAHIAVAALFANAWPYLLFAVAEQTVDSSTAGIINALSPLWTVVLALAVRHQKSIASQ